MSIVSFVRGIVKTWECGLGELGRRSRGGGVSHSEVVQDPAAGEGGHGLLHPGGERVVVDTSCSSLSSLRAL